jgi:hypothetical protein
LFCTAQCIRHASPVAARSVNQFNDLRLHGGAARRTTASQLPSAAGLLAQP